jgi:Adenylate and Guanylate cyclase catalytic domain
MRNLPGSAVEFQAPAHSDVGSFAGRAGHRDHRRRLHFASAFIRAYTVDASTGPKELGMSSFGHRRHLLRAIAELKSLEKKGAPKLAPATAAVTPQPHDAAERRQVTVMFSDLVGSTALSARMDPEDLREVISAYQKCVAETVRRFGGFVGKYMGDGVLIYFGYPQAHEDDAERAVRAGLELIAAVTALKTRVSLQTRVGIATGIVVVGDLIGSGEAHERGIVGETPNLAAACKASQCSALHPLAARTE